MKVSRFVIPAETKIATSWERSLLGGLKVRRNEASSDAKAGSKEKEGGEGFEGFRVEREVAIQVANSSELLDRVLRMRELTRQVRLRTIE